MGTAPRKLFLPTAFVLVLIGVGFVGIMLLRSLHSFSWENSMPSNINRIAFAIEYFKQNEGVYPNTLKELATNEDFGEEKKYLNAVLNDYGNVYYYQISSSGSSLKVVNSPSFFNSRKEMVKQFATGEALEHK